MEKIQQQQIYNSIPYYFFFGTNFRRERIKEKQENPDKKLFHDGTKFTC